MMYTLGRFRFLWPGGIQEMSHAWLVKLIRDLRGVTVAAFVSRVFYGQDQAISLVARCFPGVSAN